MLCSEYIFKSLVLTIFYHFQMNHSGRSHGYFLMNCISIDIIVRWWKVFFFAPSFLYVLCFLHILKVPISIILFNLIGKIIYLHNVALSTIPYIIESIGLGMRFNPPIPPFASFRRNTGIPNGDRCNSFIRCSSISRKSLWICLKKNCSNKITKLFFSLILWIIQLCIG